MHIPSIPGLPPSRRHGFTLVELLAVTGAIVLLIALLLPSLAKARAAAEATKCLANLRNLELAQCNYVADNHGALIEAGLGHGAESDDAAATWLTTLQRYYQTPLAARCPSDDSPYWPDGSFVPGSSPPKHRVASYCINDFVAGEAYCPWGPGFEVPCPSNMLYTKISRIPRPSTTVQFCELAYAGDFAGADHCHVENWVGNVPNSASKNLQTDAHGGPAHGWAARANYGFLDGHAERLPFAKVFTSIYVNRFDPSLAN